MKYLPTLETERLIIRPITLDDLQDFYEMDSQPEVHIYLKNQPIKTIDETKEIIENLLIQYNELGHGRVAVVEKESGKMIGWTGFKYMTENADRIVHIHLKDGIDHTPKALGEGDADLATVIKAAKKIGLKWVILENDNPTPTGLEDAARSMEYMIKNI